MLLSSASHSHSLHVFLSYIHVFLSPLLLSIFYRVIKSVLAKNTLKNTLSVMLLNCYICITFVKLSPCFHHNNTLHGTRDMFLFWRHSLHLDENDRKIRHIWVLRSVSPSLTFFCFLFLFCSLFHFLQCFVSSLFSSFSFIVSLYIYSCISSSSSLSFIFYFILPVTFSFSPSSYSPPSAFPLVFTSFSFSPLFHPHLSLFLLIHRSCPLSSPYPWVFPWEHF